MYGRVYTKPVGVWHFEDLASKEVFSVDNPKALTPGKHENKYAWAHVTSNRALSGCNVKVDRVDTGDGKCQSF